MITAANISQIPKRSPFRYPGGKTWLIPQIREWLIAVANPSTRMVEPFAGGGIVSLTSVMEGLVKSALMIELDPDVAAVWQAILGDSWKSLTDRITGFELNDDSVRTAIQSYPADISEYAFQTILKNRVKRNGIIAGSAGFLKNGESGNGLKSRWYPLSISHRIRQIHEYRSSISFTQGDGLKYLNNHRLDADVVYFIDPPYNGVGKKLYQQHTMDLAILFKIISKLRGDFLLTLNNSTEVMEYVNRYNYSSKEIMMNCGSAKVELVIGRDLSWLNC
ncbi:DNA adenine methylase [Dehalogenimonas alkenigignens]|uniref:DNA adenine methylase n=1 Tax=Dehalogenimonas alkenigignens TaxID=1217799 RepID=UPI001F0C7E53|nr:DNA adenine methylase [Dehalogenimonas alkenigignens]